MHFDLIYALKRAATHVVAGIWWWSSTDQSRQRSDNSISAATLAGFSVATASQLEFWSLFVALGNRQSDVYKFLPHHIINIIIIIVIILFINVHGVHDK